MKKKKGREGKKMKKEGRKEKRKEVKKRKKEGRKEKRSEVAKEEKKKGMKTRRLKKRRTGNTEEG